ncbi:hypothetical protein [Streptomyces sp. NBC_00620]|uniref:hypothetical protein n=1 Tax=Streptomyces sp. NBC_00620 TaxID=2903666 RepID=UPI002B1E4D9C|nr:hypothetical protein [Streptomyces sp. NBC_00620]
MSEQIEQPVNPGPVGEFGPVEPVPEPVPEVLDSAPESPEPAPGKKPVRWGRIAAVAGSVVLLGAVVAGAGYTVVTVGDADRDAGAPTWTFPKAAKDDAKTAKAASGLAAMLVPYDTDGWTRGPDIAEYGSDASLSGAQAAALRKKALSDLPRSERRQLEKEIDKQRTKGMAMRSYADGVSTVSIVLAQMEDKKAVRGMSTFQNEFFDALGTSRKGPKIEGYKNAECFLPDTDSDEKLDMMVCSAYQGDVLVSATAYGVKPLDTKGVAALLREQLDRIAEPGEAV